MATSTTSVNCNLSTDANCRLLWGAVDAQIQALGGWTYDAQTGDVDPSTVAYGSAGTFAGFRVYSTTAGSTTWYLRLDFGHNGSNAPWFKYQIGTSVNGSGTLGGQTGTQVNPTTGDTDTETLYMSAAAGRLTLVLSSANFSFAFAMHGSVDNTGAMNGGMETFDSISNSQYVPASGTVPTKRTLWPCAYGNSTSDVIGGATMTGHPVLWDGTGANNPTLAVMVVSSADFTALFSTTVSVYSSTRTFLTTAHSNPLQQGVANGRGAYRYE